MAREESVGAMDDREAAKGNPPGPRRGRLIKPLEEPTPGGDQDRPTEKGGATWRQGQAGRPRPGCPTPLCSLWCSAFA